MPVSNRDLLRALLPRAAAYAIAVLFLSSVDFTYAWYAALDTPEGPADWYSEVGIRAGVILLVNHDRRVLGFLAGTHLPSLPVLPIYAGAGPEGGGLFIAIWLLAAIAFYAHFWVHALRRQAA